MPIVEYILYTPCQLPMRGCIVYHVAMAIANNLVQSIDVNIVSHM